MTDERNDYPQVSEIESIKLMLATWMPAHVTDPGTLPEPGSKTGRVTAQGSAAMTTKEQAHATLYKAAARMGASGHSAALAAATAKQVRDCRNGKLALYQPTQEHVAIIKAMGQVLSGELSPEDAMGLLWEGETMIQRGVY